MPSERYLRHKGQPIPPKPGRFFRHPNPEPHILLPRCQAMTESGSQCKNESSRWDFCYQHKDAT